MMQYLLELSTFETTFILGCQLAVTDVSISE